MTDTQFEHIIDEFRGAAHVYFIPLRIEDCEIPDFLRKLQWVDYFEPDGFDLLCRAIESRGAKL